MNTVSIPILRSVSAISNGMVSWRVCMPRAATYQLCPCPRCQVLSLVENLQIPFATRPLASARCTDDATEVTRPAVSNSDTIELERTRRVYRGPGLTDFPIDKGLCRYVRLRGPGLAYNSANEYRQGACPVYWTHIIQVSVRIFM